MPFAARHPGARVVGIDLSPVQIAEGQARLAEMGLTNAELKQMDLSQIDMSDGEFDYIICHGVYSWVPPTVQDAILRIASENLTENG